MAVVISASTDRVMEMRILDVTHLNSSSDVLFCSVEFIKSMFLFKGDLYPLQLPVGKVKTFRKCILSLQEVLIFVVLEGYGPQTYRNFRLIIRNYSDSRQRFSWLAPHGMLCLQNRGLLFLLGHAVEKGMFHGRGEKCAVAPELALPCGVVYIVAQGNHPCSSSRAVASLGPLWCGVSPPVKCLL